MSRSIQVTKRLSTSGVSCGVFKSPREANQMKARGLGRLRVSPKRLLGAVVLRAVAVVREDADSLPKRPTFGPSKEWADLALDRTHRIQIGHAKAR